MGLTWVENFIAHLVRVGDIRISYRPNSVSSSKGIADVLHRDKKQSQVSFLMGDSAHTLSYPPFVLKTLWITPRSLTHVLRITLFRR